MKLNKLREIIANYQKLLAKPTDENYASIIAVEEILKQKQIELQTKTKEFERYVSTILHNQCTVEVDYSYVRIYYNNSLFSKNDKPNNCLTTYIGSKNWVHSNPQNKKIQHNQANNTCKLLEKDKTSNNFLKYLTEWLKKYCFGEKFGLETNIGLYIGFNCEENFLKMLISDSDSRNNLPRSFRIFRPTFFAPENIDITTKERIMNFYYLKNIITGERELHFNNDDTKEIINETTIADIYTKLKVDISSFPKELQDEIRNFEAYYQMKLHERADNEKASLKIMQTKRIMEAYQKFKEAIELLNNLKMEDITLDKIHMDDLENIFFKNNGKPNEQGYIEINEMFKDNMLLRMLDLSNINLTNVDIRGMDFSGTNINIHPQTIYNKDMTNVNTTGVKFSPFKLEDQFTDVILDGTIIDDYEAMIDLNTVKSYNNQTIIPTKQRKI